MVELVRCERCEATMMLPPQTGERWLRCEAMAPHDGQLHVATDPDGIVRRWPDDGPAWEAASGDYAGLR